MKVLLHHNDMVRVKWFRKSRCLCWIGTWIRYSRWRLRRQSDRSHHESMHAVASLLLCCLRILAAAASLHVGTEGLIEQECRLGMSEEMLPLLAGLGIQDIARIAACMFSEGSSLLPASSLLNLGQGKHKVKSDAAIQIAGAKANPCSDPNR